MPAHVSLDRVDAWRLVIPRSGPMNVDATVYASERIRLEDGALQQLADAAALPGAKRVLATPDIHLGYGVPIGCVAGLAGIVVPAAVGYDVNCGMRLLTTPLEAKDVDAGRIAHSIGRDVPLGAGKRNVALTAEQLETVLERGLEGLQAVHPGHERYSELRDEEEDAADVERAEERGSVEGAPGAVSEKARSRGRPQLGTLGGGNHFIELQRVDRVDDAELAGKFGVHEGQLVIMIHSGSRGFGHQVGGDYMKKAERIADDRAPSKKLAFLEIDSAEGRGYVGAMNCAANFAFANRQVMTTFVRAAFRAEFGPLDMPCVYDVPHNMAKLEEHSGERLWVHRKGATRAFGPERMAGTPFELTGQPVLIPGSMGTASYLLVAGERAADSLWSVNHGAGRTMSRTAAAGKVSRKGKVLKPGRISDEDFDRAMEGVVLISGNRRLAKEEAPQAYKDIDAVIETVAGAGLGRIVARMVPLAVLKG